MYMANGGFKILVYYGEAYFQTSNMRLKTPVDKYTTILYLT
jgi:hypothetical protein